MIHPDNDLAFSADFQPLFDAAPVGLAVFDPEGRYLRVNAELAAINGVPAAAHIGRAVPDVLPAMGAAVLDLIRRVVATGGTVRDLEVSGETPREPGELRHWLCGFYPIRGDGGAIRAVGAWVTEITERKRALRALEASRLQLQMGVEAAGLVMADIDYRSNQNHLSAELARLMELGDGPMTVPRQAIFDRIHPDDRQRYLDAIAHTIDPAGNGHLAIDVRALLPSGTVRWLHIRLQVTFAMIDGQLRPDRGICAARDVTAEMLAERRLRAAQRLAESVIEGAGALVYAKDLRGRYILSNQAWRTLHGLDVAQAEGATDDQLFGPELAAQLRANDRQVADTGQALLTQEQGLVHGQQATFRTSKFPLYDEAGQIYAVCGVSTDITDVVEADRRKDEFLAVLAHELRNPLAPIRTGLEILKRVGELPPPATRTRDMMERQLVHMVRLIDDLLDVSRVSRGKLELRVERLPLQRVLDHALEASRPAIDAAGHQLALEVPAQPLWVDGDLSRLSQVVSNLLNNAARYTPPGGRITLTARADAAQALVEVADTGPGIPPEMRPHLFSLFAQGRAAQRSGQGGLGIGLWLVNRLVGLHRGELALHSDAGGTRFTVRLPSAAAPA